MKVVVLLGGENKRFLEKDYQTHKALLKINSAWLANSGCCIPASV